MRLLILGGTEFVGRALAEAAVARGWQVTAFNRGRQPSPAGTRPLRGDRTATDGLAALHGGEWDLVVDTWSGAPRVVREAARALSDRADRYAYVSSCSVYPFPARPGNDESDPVVDGSPDAGQIDYASDKRGGELAAVEAFGAERALLVRAGLILGPYENTRRLTWWLNRMARGGPVLAPGPREAGVQYVDVRDLAEWTLDALTDGRDGPYNLVGPAGATTMGELLETCAGVAGPNAELRWVEPRVLTEAGIEPWTEMPMWLPPGDPNAAVYQQGVAKALAAGLRPRPLAETVRDTWAWLSSRGGDAPQRPDRPSVRLDPAREAEVLAGLG
ncbi:NAD-dependent epimerase/dehydratase family protein [Streptomyces oceani]|uniref:Reductase n=1 Tax=Streptomyces oceani TaxID=1075402 RepID=A0A1E7KK23_9ACTN|nr:NAD-dependent epimerase/dehydratase family protein [Streptomyces oceani]OEV04329.1 reductase [Streptomyces oceani]